MPLSLSFICRNTQLFALSLLTVLLLAGCASQRQRQAQDDLTAGQTALEQHQYDEAIRRADAFLRRQPEGEGAAQAFYFRGRALQDRPAGSDAEWRRNWTLARDSYLAALRQPLTPQLEAYVRTSLGNAAYFLDEYPTAIEQFTTAMAKLDRPDLQAWTAYRLGLSYQRLGRFAEADGAFAAVQRQFPGSLPAQRAREHQGARAFTLQVGVFSTPQAAEAAVAALKKQGLVPQRLIDAQGRQVVRVGSAATYAEAQILKARLAALFPAAMIVP